VRQVVWRLRLPQLVQSRELPQQAEELGVQRHLHLMAESLKALVKVLAVLAAMGAMGLW
jgi:hypothetical protein